ncbi:MAG: 50S ribosomal protein L4 [bacterium]|nr:50S ribosomal protein L4 [bacterium]
MVEIKVYDGGNVTSKEVDSDAFGGKVLGRTLKDAVVMYESNMRQGTVRAKTRSQVRGPNKKLWRQKHTGRARMGTTKSPIWRGGGRIHPPEPRDHTYAMPKKMRRAALRNAIFTKFRDGEVGVASGWPADKPSTKTAHAVLNGLGMGRSATVVTSDLDRNLVKSLRNVPLVDVCTVDDLNARQVLLRRYLVLTPAAYEAVEKKFATGAPASGRKES